MKFTRQAAADLEFWKRSNPATVKRIKLLLSDIEASPYSGLGKPEALNMIWRAGGQGGLPANIAWCIV